jgi:hypothetical protein
MEENTNYVKRSQRDYSMSLKLQIVSEIGAEVYPLLNQKKYGIQARSTVSMVTKIW